MANNTTNFFDNLKRSGFMNKNGDVNLSKINNAKISNIVDVALENATATAMSEVNDNSAMFIHSASISLGAGRTPCENIKCRLEKAKKLSQFAALYSDRVYIMNFLSDYQHIEKNDEIRSTFYDDLKILTYLKPLIEEGKIAPFTTSVCCPQCFASTSLGSDADQRFIKEYKKLEKKCLEQISCVVEKLADNVYGLRVKGPEEIVEHGGMNVVRTSPWPLLSSSIVTRLHKGQQITLSSRDIKKLQIHTALTNDTYRNIQFEIVTSQVFQTSFLTESIVHINTLNAISENRSFIKRNSIIEKHLTALVPFLNDIEPANLIKLRSRELESFVIFRESLNRAIVECKSYERGFSERIAKEIYSDIIFPKLTKLDLKMKKAKRDLIKSTGRKTLAWVGAISLGIYSGFLSTELAKAASALGLTKIVADLLETTMIKSDTAETIRNDEMYFLWKVRQLSKK